METEPIITWRDGTGSSVQSSVDRVPTSSSYRQHHIFKKNVLYQFPVRQLPTSSIPTLSTLTKWELTTWELMKWEVDQMGIDKVGIDKVGRYRAIIRSEICKSVSKLLQLHSKR